MAQPKTRLPKALSPQDVARMKFDTLPFGKKFAEAFGTPERRGIWLMWGASGSGKTSMAMLLAKELTKFGRVAYNSLEQGASLAIQQAFERHKMQEVRRGSFYLLSEDLDILSERLTRKQAPDFVVIDSIQYSGLDSRTYRKFKEKHRNKLIIFVSHAEGQKPEGRTATKVQYDADMKILVEGYRAVSKGRFFGREGAYFTIWEEGASRYWLCEPHGQGAEGQSQE